MPITDGVPPLLCLSLISTFYAKVTAFLFLGFDKSLSLLLFSDILRAPNTQNVLKHSQQWLYDANTKKKPP
jgi:hypothetical protein